MALLRCLSVDLGSILSPQRIAHIIFYILRAKAVRTFHKLNVHAGMELATCYI